MALYYELTMQWWQSIGRADQLSVWWLVLDGQPLRFCQKTGVFWAGLNDRLPTPAFLKAWSELTPSQLALQCLSQSLEGLPELDWHNLPAQHKDALHSALLWRFPRETRKEAQKLASVVKEPTRLLFRGGMFRVVLQSFYDDCILQDPISDLTFTENKKEEKNG